MWGIVEFRKVVPDEINNLIAKFVGVKTHPIAKMFNALIEYSMRTSRNPEYTVANALHLFLVIKKSDIIHRVWKTYDRLKHLKSDKARRGEFIKLPQWLKNELLNNNFYLSRLFKDTKVNRRFLNM
jgi:hypothetical protein